jgi:hypothetical protein
VANLEGHFFLLGWNPVNAQGHFLRPQIFLLLHQINRAKAKSINRTVDPYKNNRSFLIWQVHGIMD